MASRTVDYDGLNREDIAQLRNAVTPDHVPFVLQKISHVVLKVADLEQSVQFYTQVTGMRVLAMTLPVRAMPVRLAIRMN